MPARSNMLLGLTIGVVLIAAGLGARAPNDEPSTPSAHERAAASVAEIEIADDPPSSEATPQVKEKRSARTAKTSPRVRAGKVVAQTVERQKVRTTVDRSSSSSGGSGGNPLKKIFPDQFAAGQSASEPATQHWALLIGIDKYSGGTSNTIGSVADAKALRSHLLSEGWRSDHIMFLKDRHATAANIVHAIRWLRSKTTGSSVVVFSYGGHEKPLRTSADGDNEARDVALWATDNKLVVDGDLGRELGRIRSARMWIHMATCRAGGFDDPGMAGRNRLITYSSPEHELSYEDPQYGHSVIGYHMLELGLRQGHGDRNGDGIVTVEEAFAYAKPRVRSHTSDRQHPFNDDAFAGGFRLKVPQKPTSPPPDPDEPDEDTCTLIVCPNSGSAKATSREY
ncbi:MAG TPA: caspase family protein [Actinomycetota bacterium]